MKLKYTELDGKKSHIVKATLTTDHHASNYGQPVLVLSNGEAIDAVAWVFLGYQVISATEDEKAALKKLGFYWGF